MSARTQNPADKGGGKEKRAFDPLPVEGKRDKRREPFSFLPDYVERVQAEGGRGNTGATFFSPFSS